LSGKCENLTLKECQILQFLVHLWSPHLHASHGTSLVKPVDENGAFHEMTIVAHFVHTKLKCNIDTDRTASCSLSYLSNYSFFLIR
jgi:hypothetical protein